MSRPIAAALIVAGSWAVMLAANEQTAEIERRATGFTCTERVFVSQMKNDFTDQYLLGESAYLLEKPKKKKEMPYRFKERRFPKLKDPPWNLLEQPVPFSWGVLQDPDPEMFLAEGACPDEDLESCREFLGRRAFRDGDDPREWRGKVWLDPLGRIRRIEAEPTNLGPRIERVVEYEEAPPAPMPGAAPGSGFGNPRFRVDGSVQEIHCEIEFGEPIPGWRLPLRTACHRDTLGVGGSLRKRWTVTREFSDCKLFNVETNEDIERIGEP